MRFNFLLPILAAAMGFGSVAQAASTASQRVAELQAQMGKAIAQACAKRSALRFEFLSGTGDSYGRPHTRNRWNQRKLRKRARCLASASTPSMRQRAFA